MDRGASGKAKAHTNFTNTEARQKLQNSFFIIAVVTFAPQICTTNSPSRGMATIANYKQMFSETPAVGGRDNPPTEVTEPVKERSRSNDAVVKNQLQ